MARGSEASRNSYCRGIAERGFVVRCTIIATSVPAPVHRAVTSTRGSRSPIGVARSPTSSRSTRWTACGSASGGAATRSCSVPPTVGCQQSSPRFLWSTASRRASGGFHPTLVSRWTRSSTQTSALSSRANRLSPSRCQRRSSGTRLLPRSARRRDLSATAARRHRVREPGNAAVDALDADEPAGPVGRPGVSDALMTIVARGDTTSGTDLQLRAYEAALEPKRLVLLDPCRSRSKAPGTTC